MEVRVGAVFVPLNDSLIPDFVSKIDHIVNDCHPHAAIIVAQHDLDDRVKQMNGRGVFRLILLEGEGTLVLEESMAEDLPESLPPTLHYEDVSSPPLYILYTSGSTGKPKGVIGTHRGLINRLVWQIDTFPWGEDEVACRRTPITFVDALAEIFSALLCGVPLWVPNLRQIEEQGMHSIVGEAAEAGVTRITMIPSQLHHMLRFADDLLTWTALRFVIISGEKASMDLVRAFIAVCPEVTLVNLYGSTEVAGDVTYAILNRHLNHHHANAPIGLPIDNNSIYLLKISDEDHELQLVDQDNVPGQLAVSGSHLCKGYLNYQDSGNYHFSSKFRQNPFSNNNGLLFLTGDIAIRSADVGYTWLGRLDHQIKVRGVRVGLEEMESTISQIINHHRVVMVSINRNNDYEDTTLILVIEIDPEMALSSEDYLKSLRHVLPSIAMPSAVIPMKDFPLTSSGKVDRKSVSAMMEGVFSKTSSAGDEGPSLSQAKTNATTSETILSKVKSLVQSVLLSSTLIDAPVIDSESSFFELGGDSMRAVELLWKLRNEFQVTLAITDLKLAVKDLSQEIAARQQNMIKEEQIREESDKVDILNSISANPRKRKLSESRSVLTKPRSPHRILSKSCSIGKGDSGCGCKLEHEEGVPEGCQMTIDLRWKAKLKKCIDSTVLFVSRTIDGRQDELIVVGSHGGDLACFMANTGELKWTCELGEHIEGSAVVDHNNRLFLGTYAANDVDMDMPSADSQNDKGCLYAIELENGEVAWSRRVRGEVKCTPLIFETMNKSRNIWIGAYDGVLYCFNAEIGELNQSIDCEGAIYGSPCYSKEAQTVYCATIRGYVYAIDTTTFSITWKILIDSPIYSSILYYSQQLIFGAIDSSIYAVDAHNGNIRRTHKATKPIFSSPVKMISNNSEGFVVGSHDGYLRYLTMDGELVWSLHLKSVVFASPFVFYDRYIAVSTTAGNIYLIDGKSGAILSSISLPAEVFSTPIVVNRILYCGCRDDHIYALQMEIS